MSRNRFLYVVITLALVVLGILTIRTAVATSALNCLGWLGAACNTAPQSNAIAPTLQARAVQPAPTVTEIPLTPTLAATPTMASNSSIVQFVWAIKGAPNKLLYPTKIAVDAHGDIYVADNLNDRIQKFDSNGKFLTMWGSRGTGEGQIILNCVVDSCSPTCPPLPPGWNHCPHLPAGGLAVDEQGNVYVSDFNGRIDVFDGSGKFLRAFGSEGDGDGQFRGPHGVAVDGYGNVYVTDFILHRVQKFDRSGKFLTKWGSQGKGDGQFDRPSCVTVDAQGRVYVADAENVRIEQFDAEGKFLRKWSGHDNAYGAECVAVDRQGNVYLVANPGEHVEKFDSQGNFLGRWGSNGPDNGEFSAPSGIAVDGEGNIYVVDTLNNNVQKFRPR